MLRKLKIGVPVMALAMAVSAAFAFRDAPVQKVAPVQQEVKRTLTTYVYTGDNTTTQQRQSQWYVKDNNAESCGGIAQKICLIVTGSDEGAHPDFSSGNPVDNPSLFEDVMYKPLD